MSSQESPINKDLEITNHISTSELAPGYPVIQLSNIHGTATVALHGAHVIEYTPADQQPVIFTSKQAIFKEGKAIRGGIPICWPWFNAHPTDPSLPSHGYARNQFWKVTSSEHASDSTSITLTFTIDNLRAEATITLGTSLEVSLTTTNTSELPQTVGGALHSYFKVSNIANITINGLKDTKYINTVTNTNETQSGEISITQEIDNIYLDTNATTKITDSEWNRTITVEKGGSQSTIVWNPWIEKSSNIGDLGNEEYLSFVCIEAANAREDVYILAPNETHTLSTKITSA